MARLPVWKVYERGTICQWRVYKRGIFSAKTGKGSDLGSEPPCIKSFLAPPSPGVKHFLAAMFTVTSHLAHDLWLFNKRCEPGAIFNLDCKKG